MNESGRIAGASCMALAALLVAPASPARAQEGVAQVPVSAKWDDEAKRIIPRIIENNADMGSAVKVFHSVSCIIDVTVTTNVSPNPMLATLRYAWEDGDDNGFLTGDEIQVDVVHVSGRAMGAFIRELSRGLKTETVNSSFNLFAKHDVTTRRKEDGGYIMELVPVEGGNWDQGGIQKMHLVVTPDFRVTSLQAKTFEGAKIDAEFDHLRFGDKWVPSTQKQRVTQSDGGSSQESRRYHYEERGGIPILMGTSIEQVISTAYATVSTSRRFTVRDWSGREREQPIPAPGSEDYEELFRRATPAGEEPLIEDDEPLVTDDEPLIEEEAPDRPRLGTGVGRPPVDEGDLFEEEEEAGLFEEEDAGGLFEDEPRPAAQDDGAPELAAQLMEKINSLYFSWKMYPGRSFTAQFGLKEGNQTIATFDATPAELSVCQTADPLTSAMMNELMRAFEFPWNNLLAGPLYTPRPLARTWLARETPEGYLLRGRDRTGRLVEEIGLTREWDLKQRTAWVPSPVTGTLTRFVFDYEVRTSREVKYLRKLDVHQFLEQGELLMERQYKYTYHHVDDAVFAKRISVSGIHEGAPLQGTFEVIEFELD